MLASEMSEIKGGTMSSSCGGSLTKPDQALESEEFSSVMGYNITMNKIKHNLRFVLFILLFFQGTILFSQNTIKGIVCDTDGLAIPYANVLLCLNDSIIAQSISTEHGFLLENIPENSYILNVSHVGYQIKKISLNVKSNIDLDSIQLSLLTLELDEVVIRTIRNVTTYKTQLKD